MPFWRRPGINAGWAAAALTLLVGGVSLWRLNATLRVSRTGERIETTLDTLEDVLSRLKDAETGQRGYILTGDSAYLAPYRIALNGLQSDIAALRRLTDGHDANRQRVVGVEPFIARRLAEIDTTISLRRSAGFDAAVKVIRTNAGKNSMDSVRAAVAAISVAEHARFADARHRQDDSVRVAFIVILGGTLAAFALAMIAQEFVRTAAARLRRNAAELAATNAELEVKTHAADAASQAKTDFLAVMSHELRTPLNAILGHASLLADGVGGSVTPSQSTSLRRIQKAARRLVDLIDEILVYARLGRGREAVNVTDTDLGELVADTMALVEHVFDGKGLTLQYERPSTPCVIRTDSAKVSHILLNLLTNAAKFTTSGRVVIALHTDASSATIAICDSGVGMTPENLLRVFEPFTQADQRRSRSAEGAGLGLTIARRLARLLGGDLTVESTLGVGSTFLLRLPLDSQRTPSDADDTTALDVARTMV